MVALHIKSDQTTKTERPILDMIVMGMGVSYIVMYMDVSYT